MSYKTYLDEQPELDSIVRSFIESLDPEFEHWGESTFYPIECRSRDGFIPHLHNCGGYDISFITDLGFIQSTGYELAPGFDRARADEVSEHALESARFDFRDKLEGIPEDKQNYHSLRELGHEELADALDEYCSSWLGDSTIYFGYRAMYEGIDSEGEHTLMLYASANESEYYGFCSKGSTTLKEIEIKFKTPAQLRVRLEAIRDELHIF